MAARMTVEGSGVMARPRTASNPNEPTDVPAPVVVLIVGDLLGDHIGVGQVVERSRTSSASNAKRTWLSRIQSLTAYP